MSPSIEPSCRSRGLNLPGSPTSKGVRRRRRTCGAWSVDLDGRKVGELERRALGEPILPRIRPKNGVRLRSSTLTPPNPTRRCSSLSWGTKPPSNRGRSFPLPSLRALPIPVRRRAKRSTSSPRTRARRTRALPSFDQGLRARAVGRELSSASEKTERASSSSRHSRARTRRNCEAAHREWCGLEANDNFTSLESLDLISSGPGAIGSVLRYLASGFVQRLDFWGSFPRTSQ
jgi:hypothetical protein